MTTTTRKTAARLIGFSTTATPRHKDHRYYAKEALHAYRQENPRKRKVYPVYIETEGAYRMFTESAVTLDKAEGLLG